MCHRRLEGTIHQNALAFWIATLNLYPLLVSLISVHPPPSLTNPGFITWGSVHRPLYLRFGLAALRRFFVRFSSNLRPEGLLKGVRSNQGRISDGTWFRNRRRLRTARWALACLPMRSPSSSFLTLQRYGKDFILQNFSAKKCSENWKLFRTNWILPGFFRFLYNGWYNLQNVLKHATPITVLQLQFFSRRGSKTWKKILYYIYIYNIIIITCVILDRG